MVILALGENNDDYYGAYGDNDDDHGDDHGNDYNDGYEDDFGGPDQGQPGIRLVITGQVVHGIFCEKECLFYQKINSDQKTFESLQ